MRNISQPMFEANKIQTKFEFFDAVTLFYQYALSRRRRASVQQHHQRLARAAGCWSLETVPHAALLFLELISSLKDTVNKPLIDWWRLLVFLVACALELRTRMPIMPDNTDLPAPWALSVICTGVPRQRDPKVFSGTGDTYVEDWFTSYEWVSAHNKRDDATKLTNVVFYLTGVLTYILSYSRSIITKATFRRGQLSRRHSLKYLVALLSATAR